MVEFGAKLESKPKVYFHGSVAFENGVVSQNGKRSSNAFAKWREHSQKGKFACVRKIERVNHTLGRAHHVPGMSSVAQRSMLVLLSNGAFANFVSSATWMKKMVIFLDFCIFRIWMEIVCLFFYSEFIQICVPKMHVFKWIFEKKIQIRGKCKLFEWIQDNAHFSNEFRENLNSNCKKVCIFFEIEIQKDWIF